MTCHCGREVSDKCGEEHDTRCCDCYDAFVAGEPDLCAKCAEATE